MCRQFESAPRHHFLYLNSVSSFDFGLADSRFDNNSDNNSAENNFIYRRVIRSSDREARSFPTIQLLFSGDF